jgi:HAMP domain-containing protein
MTRNWRPMVDQGLIAGFIGLAAVAAVLTVIRRKNDPRLPPRRHPILEVPLELKLLGANLIVVGVALVLMFGPVQLPPSRPANAYILVVALMLGAAMNFGLVRVALRPLKSIERVAKSVSQGRLGERVPVSVLADHELARLSRTINGLLDSLAADRKRIEKLGAELACGEDGERSQVARTSRATPSGGMTQGLRTTEAK